MICNIGQVGCLNSEGKAIKPTNLKLVAKYAFLQALSNLTNRLAGSEEGFRTRVDLSLIGGLTWNAESAARLRRLLHQLPSANPCT